MLSQETGITAPAGVPGPHLIVEPQDHIVPMVQRLAHEAMVPTTGAVHRTADIPPAIVPVEVLEVINLQVDPYQDQAIIPDLPEPPEVQEAIGAVAAVLEALEATEAAEAVPEVLVATEAQAVHPEVQVVQADRQAGHPDLVEEAADHNKSKLHHS